MKGIASNDSALPVPSTVDAACERALHRFTRAYPGPIAALRLDGASKRLRLKDTEVPSDHPTCENCLNRGQCGTEWKVGCQDHAPQYAYCRSGNFVCSVPFLFGGEIAVVFRLVEPGTLPKASFKHRVELLAELLQESVSADGGVRRKTEETGDDDSWYQRSRAGMHPQIAKTIAYINDNLCDPRMNVASVAQALNVNATYLSHIFSEEVGIRMSRYIAGHRIQVAKKLLATTDWQIKRVAFESGHSNADWFSQVFHAHAGVPPCKYRRMVRRSAGPSSAEAAG